MSNSMQRSSSFVRRATLRQRGSRQRRLQMESLENRSLLATLVWQGDADTNWSNLANWAADEVGTAAGSVPAVGDTLIFKTGVAGFTSFTTNNDITGLTGLTLQITDNSAAGDFNITGSQAIGLTTITHDQSVGTATTLGAAVTLTGATNTLDIIAGRLNVTGAVGGTGGLIKNGLGTLALNTGNNYVGGTTIGAGTLSVGNATALSSTASQLTLNAGGTLDLNGNSITVSNITGAVGSTIIDNAAGAGTSTLTISNQSTSHSGLVLDGPTRVIAVRVGNNNINNNPVFALNSQNTFSGGLTLLGTGGGTRLHINGAITTTGTAGAIVSGPFGRGAINIGTVATDKAGIWFTTGTTLLNDLVFNTALGTDRAGIRAEATGIVLAGKQTANLAPVMFSTNGTGTVLITGQITGPQGFTIDNQFGTSVAVTLNNTSASPNNYQGATVIDGTKGTIILAAANQIPDGATASHVENRGTINLNTFSETINGLFGTGIVTSNAGATATLTVGANDISSAFVGTIQDGGGKVALTKSGSGIFALLNTNTFTGDTLVAQGTLTLNGAPISSGLAYQLDATQTNTLLLAGGTPVVNAGDAVNQWNLLNPITANNYVAVAGRLPTYQPVSTINSKPAVRFDGVDDRMILGTAINPQTVFIVNTPLAVQKSIAGIFGSSGDKGIRYGGGTTPNYNSGTNGDDFINPQNNIFVNGVRTFTAGAIAHVVTEFRGTGHTTAYTNNILGGYYDTREWAGDVGEVLVYTTTLTRAQQLFNEAYLTSKWLTTLGTSRLSDTTAVTVAAGATFDLANNTETIGSLAGAGSVKLGSATLTSGGNNTSTVFSGDISGTGGMVKAGTGTLTLSNTISTYTGSTAVQNGVLSIASIASVGGDASSIGAPTTVPGGTIALGSAATTGTLLYTGTGATTDRVINLAGTTGGGTLDQSGTGLLRFTSNLTATGVGSKTFTLQGSTAGTGEFAGAIVDNSVANTTTVSKAGTGTWFLTNNTSTYTGLTVFNAGILNVASVSDYGAPSSIGARTAAVETASGNGIGLHFRGGTLQYTGATPQSTNRQIRVINSATGATIDASGSVPSATLSFTYTAANTNLYETGGTRTIILTGSNTGANRFAIRLTDQVVGTANTSLTKTGAGSWTISGANTYNGATTIVSGTLVGGATNTLPSGTTVTIGTSVATAGAGTTGNLDLSNFSQTISALNIRSDSAAVNTVTIGAGQTLNVTGTGSLSIGVLPAADSRTTNATFTGGGALNVNNTAGIVNFGLANSNQNSPPNASTINMTGLSSFSAIANEVRVAYNSRIATTLLLSNTSNYINANVLSIGNSLTNNAATPILVELGAGTNTFEVTTLDLGKGKSIVTMDFASQAPGSPGTLTITGKTGGASTADINIGNNTQVGTAATVTATLDLRGHVVNVQAGTLLMGDSNNGTAAIGSNATLSFDAGTFSVNTIIMARKSGTSAGAATATLNIGGGLFTVNAGGSFTLASQTGSSSASGTLNITGGTLVSNVDIVDAGATTTTTININGGTLDLTGRTLGLTAPINAINAQSGTLKNVGEITAGATLNKTTTGMLLLDGVNTYTAPTVIAEGTVLVGSNTALPSGSAFTLGTGTTAGVLDLNGFNGTIASLTSSTNSTTATNQVIIDSGNLLSINGNVLVGPAINNATTLLTFSGGGDLLVDAPGGSFILGGYASIVTNNYSKVAVSLAGLSNFSANLGAAGSFLVGRTGDNSGGTWPTSLSLATNSTITAGTLTVGQSANGSLASMVLGSGVNTLNVDTFNIGTGSRDPGSVTFAGAAGALTVRDAAGTGRANLNIGTGGSGTGYAANSVLDLAGHNADLLLNTLTIGNQARGGAVTNLFNFNTGTLDATAVKLGFQNGGTATANPATSTINLGGGTVIIGTGGLEMGTNTSTGATARTVSAIVNISGGTVNIANSAALGGAIRMANNSAASGNVAVASQLNITGGVVTLAGSIVEGVSTRPVTTALTLNGGTLDLTGNSIGGTNLIDTLNFQSGTLRNVAQINNGAALNKTTAGTLILAGTNNYSGATNITAGTVRLGNSNAIPDGTGKGNVDVAAGALLDLNGFSDTINGLTGAGTIDNSTVAGSNILAVGAGNATATFAGVLQDTVGTLTLNKVGTGTQTLSNSNSYSGGTNINGGKISVTNSNALGSGTVTIANVAGTQLLLGNGTNVANPLVIQGGSVAGQGTLHTSGTATYSGPINITGATLAGGHFGGGTLTLTGVITSSVRVDYRIGTMIVTNTGSSYTSALIGQGTLRLGATNALPTNATLLVGAYAAGTFDLNGFDQTLNGISSGAFTSIVDNLLANSTVTLTLGNNDASSTYGGSLRDTGTNAVLNLNKIGAGTLLLNGASTYTGPTQVNAGALGGSGSLTSDITVANLATLSPGGTPGTLTTTGNTTLQTGSIYRVELIGTNNDQLVTNGVDLTDAVLDASSDSNLGAGTPFLIIDNTSGAQVIGTFAGLPENASFFINGYQYFITYVYNGNDVAIIRNQMVDAINDQFGPILVNTSLTANAYTNDSDPDGDARSTVIAQPLNGKVFMDPATGVFTYTPKPNFIGTDSFTYRLSDGEFNDTAIVEIIVAPLLVDGNGVLQVGGTTGGDNIIVQAGSIRYNNTTYPLSASRVVVHGGGGNDTISVTASNIAVEFYGDDGDDYLSGGSLNDILDGGAGTDRLLGNAGDDNLYGGGGSDNLSGGVGNDYLSGDGYLDASSLEQQATDAGKDTLSGDAGDDEIHGGAGMDTLLGGIGNDYLSGGDDGDAVDGGAGHDILLGGGGGDKLYGRAGNDVLIGGEGLDTLLGDTGLDLVYGGDVTSALDEPTLRAIALQWFTPATQTAAVNQLLTYQQDDLVSDTLNGEADDDWYLIFAKDLIAATERFPGNRKTQL